jgi:hypothetical protein
MPDAVCSVAGVPQARWLSGMRLVVSRRVAGSTRLRDRQQRQQLGIQRASWSASTSRSVA